MKIPDLRPPVVAFDLGISHEWIIDGVRGFIVVRGDIPGFRNRIKTLLVDNDLSVTFGRSGSKYASKFLDRWGRMMNLTTIYETVMRGFHKN